MTPQQEQHLSDCVDTFEDLASRKYRDGVKEHHDFLGDLSPEVLVNHAIGEAIDQIFYLLTLRDKIVGKGSPGPASAGLTYNNPGAEKMGRDNIREGAMTTPEQCEAILKKVLKLANDDKPVMLSEDWGGNTLKLIVKGSHTHVGNCCEDGTWEQLVEQLYNALHGGPGLAWAGGPGGENPA